MTISQKAMIVKLHISAWKARMADKKVTAKTNLDHGATEKAGIYNKFLIPKDKLKDLQAAENEARRFHVDMTLPWKDGGDRLLPAKNFLKYNKGMRDCKQKFEHAVQSFLNQYPMLVTTATKDLGSMYNASEYPSPTVIHELFNFYTDIQPVPVSGDFRVELNEDEVAKIKKELDVSNQKSHEEAMKNLWNRLYDVVKTMADGMRDEVDPATGKVTKNGRVFESYIENIKELTSILPDLNIADDKDLNTLSEKVKNELTQHTPGQLRKDNRLKADTVKAADDIIKAMSGYTGTGGGAVNAN